MPAGAPLGPLIDHWYRMTGLARTAGTVAPVSKQDGTSALSPVEEADFVTRVEKFLAVHARRLGDPSPGADDGIGEEGGLEAARTFQAALSGAGLAGLAYPSEYGGLASVHDTRSCSPGRRRTGICLRPRCPSLTACAYPC